MHPLEHQLDECTHREFPVEQDIDGHQQREISDDTTVNLFPAAEAFSRMNKEAKNNATTIVKAIACVCGGT
jgi:hypothetical protein